MDYYSKWSLESSSLELFSLCILVLEAKQCNIYTFLKYAIFSTLSAYAVAGSVNSKKCAFCYCIKTDGQRGYEDPEISRLSCMKTYVIKWSNGHNLVAFRLTNVIPI